MALSTLTSKGQVTIPKPIREKLRIEPGHRLDFQLAPSGEVVIKVLNRDLRNLKGIVKSPRHTPVTLAEMDRAIAAGSSGE
ncbi:MAG: type II toxin-antitoxin system PrlF family antitoxin [Acidobacteriales bacterium]|nr:type II toxin-antitoxin system PrlF family antitoxin [Terriglobales bacterium]